ncbi:amidohydrolase family protein [Riemerella columbina]|uniref:amidohydrolase family protein n=1 Tax=Riemerella columbina TaxID=103810 RepID=UPI0003787C34|nr:amidohydrolase family protein [Riemerella columbina]
MATLLNAQNKPYTFVDIHSHNVLPSYLDYLKKYDALLEEGFPLPKWDVQKHLEMMKQQNIGYTILTMPAPQLYHGSTEENAKAIRQYNEETAAIASQYPQRFGFCASLPLPNVAAAIEEAKYAFETLHTNGIKLATNSNGQYLGSPELEPLMEVLNQYGAVIILHPHKPVPINENLLTDIPLAAYEYLAETTRTVVNLIVHNVPSRYPNIKFVIPHCGSFLPLELPRLEKIHPIMMQFGLMNPIDWGRNLENFYYDLAGGLTDSSLDALLSITTPEHLLYGSDYPYVNENGVKNTFENTLNVLKNNPKTSIHLHNILKNNTLKLLGKLDNIIVSESSQRRK